MAGLLALLWIVGTIAGIVFLIKPRPAWPIVSNRKRALVFLLAVFVGLPILIGIVSPSKGTPESGSSADRAAQVAKAKTPEEIAAEAAADAKAKEEADLRDMNRNPENFITLEKTRGVKGGFNAVFMLGGSITNTGKVPYKDPEILCEVFAETDTPLGRVKSTLYKELQPGKTVRFSEFNMGFVQPEWAKYSCRVTGATVLG
ncbi:MAG: hypothetical protein ACOYM5_05070 [Caulobacter sp.]